jgi:hypothetical protein
MPTARTKLQSRAAWYGKDLARSNAWVRRLGARELDEIDAALARVKGMPFQAITKADFPLDATADLLAEISEELEDGLGAMRLSGLPVTRYGEDDLRRLLWGLGTHLGTAMFQNAYGEIMGEVRDETRDAQPSYVPSDPGKVMSSRQRTRSTGPLRFHTDGADLIALLCVNNSKAGGDSKLASAVTIYNEILERRPDLLELLCQDYWRLRVEHRNTLYKLPVFGVREGKLTTQYSRTFVEQAQERADVPRLTAAQNEALDLLAEVAEEVCIHAPFTPGDLQILNNHVIYHGRTAYEDDPSGAQTRLLYRLWLSVPNSRLLPEGFDVLWGAIASGALRGGVPQLNGQRSPLVSVG